MTLAHFVTEKILERKISKTSKIIDIPESLNDDWKNGVPSNKVIIKKSESSDDYSNFLIIFEPNDPFAKELMARKDGHEMITVLAWDYDVSTNKVKVFIRWKKEKEENPNEVQKDERIQKEDG